MPWRALTSTRLAGTPRWHEAPRAPHGHGHRASRNAQRLSRRHREADTEPRNRRPTRTSRLHRTHPSAQARKPRSDRIGALPRAASASIPHLASPWERRLAHGRLRARAAKTFPRGTERPSENSSTSTSRFDPLHCRFPAGAIRTTRRAKGNGHQHKEADSHGKEHRREVARGNPRIPEAQGHRGAGGELDARSDSIDFIAIDDEELVFVDAATKCGGTTCPVRSPTRSASSASRRPTSPRPRWRLSPASATTS